MDVAANCTTNDISRNDEQCSVTTNVVENHPPLRPVIKHVNL